MRLGLIYLAAASMVLAVPPPAGAASKHRHHKHPEAISAPASGLASSHYQSEPARMIEIRPGLWISSYGCVTDLGNGRLWPCDAGTAGGGGGGM